MSYELIESGRKGIIIQKGGSTCIEAASTIAILGKEQYSLFGVIGPVVQCSFRQPAKPHGQDFSRIQDKENHFSNNRSISEWMRRDNGAFIFKRYFFENNAAFQIRGRPSWRIAPSRQEGLHSRN